MLAITPERLRAARRWLVQSAFGVLVFGVALYFCFPYDRAKDLAIAWAATQGYDVTIGSAGPGFGFAVSFKDIRVRSRPTGSGKPIRFSLESARVCLDCASSSMIVRGGTNAPPNMRWRNFFLSG